MALILITHNLGIVARIADRVAVMYAGEFVEQGAGGGVLREPAPSVHARAARCIPVPGLKRAGRSARLHPRHRAVADRRARAAAPSATAAAARAPGCVRRPTSPLTRASGEHAERCMAPCAGVSAEPRCLEARDVDARASASSAGSSRGRATLHAVNGVDARDRSAARSSASSASRAAARPRSRACCWASSRRPAGAILLDGQAVGSSTPRCAARAACSRSSRTRIPRSTRAGRSARSSCAAARGARHRRRRRSGSSTVDRDDGSWSGLPRRSCRQLSRTSSPAASASGWRSRARS